MQTDEGGMIAQALEEGRALSLATPEVPFVMEADGAEDRQGAGEHHAGSEHSGLGECRRVLHHQDHPDNAGDEHRSEQCHELELLHICHLPKNRLIRY